MPIGATERLYTTESFTWGRAKWEEIDKANAAEAGVRAQRAKSGLPPMPTTPYHRTRCGGLRVCRPGEGNIKHKLDAQGRFKQWEQPHEHREMFVQSRSRSPPHGPDPLTTYGGLVSAARHVQREGLVMLAAADFDYRELAHNWWLHANRLGYSNGLVYAMDAELPPYLAALGVPSYDGSAQANAWNGTCLQRWIQAVRMERQIAAAALVSAGLDVLLCDATVVFLRPFLPLLRATPADVVLQRDDWPSGAVAKLGTATNAGFVYLRAAGDAQRARQIVKLVDGVVERGLIEFYLRWNNIVDQYGWSLVLASQLTFERKASEFANDTVVGQLQRGNCAPRERCLRVGLLPYDTFPRHDRYGDWAALAPTAHVYHLPGPSRGLRQRLNRYDDVDFASMAGALQKAGAWLVPPTG